jgi:hypothetical protein
LAGREFAPEQRLDFDANPIFGIVESALASRVVVFAHGEPPRSDDHQPHPRETECGANIAREVVSFANRPHIAEHGVVPEGELERSVELIHGKRRFTATVTDKNAVAWRGHGFVSDLFEAMQSSPRAGHRFLPPPAAVFFRGKSSRGCRDRAALDSRISIEHNCATPASISGEVRIVNRGARFQRAHNA